MHVDVPAHTVHKHAHVHMRESVQASALRALRLHVTAACLITEAGLIKRPIRKKIPEKKERKSLERGREREEPREIQEAEDFFGGGEMLPQHLTNNSLYTKHRQ